MSLESNKAVATALFTTANSDGFATALQAMADDASWWTAMGTKTKPEMLETAAGLETVLAGPIRFEIDSVTAEDDRVAIEARSQGDLKNGRRYANKYHFLIRVRDGRIAEVREHCDTLHAVETFGPVG
ncbi:MAG: nuclear transport factor 2 family protein [Sphingobium sp.]